MNGVEIKWEAVRHRVAIAGWVIDAETHEPIAGARVAMDVMPAPFKAILQLKSIQYGARWEATLDRPDRTTTTADGRFHFLDLPEGKYTLRASAPLAGRRYGSSEAETTVARKRAEIGRMTMVQLALQPTTVKGKITSDGKKTGLFMAEVRVKGSGERAFSDAKGEYVLAGIEPGRRKIQVFAQGYKSAEEQSNLKAPGDSCTLNFVLARATS